MKKIFYFALAVSVFAAGCEKNDPKDEDNGDRYLTLTFEGDEWSGKIDSPQYMGPLLYGDGYSWYDPTTDLYSELTDSYGDNKFWGGGIAVSNYFSRDIEANNTFDQQLTVYSDDAYSGNNCVVCNGYAGSWSDSRPSLEFKSGAGMIVNLYVCPTTYFYSVAKFGNEYTPKLGKDDWLKIVATAYTRGIGGEEVEVKVDGKRLELELYLYRNGEFAFDDWTEWNLSEFGEIWKVKFDMQWSGGADTFMIPAYFAIDDITVYKNIFKE